jgi:MuDR family transposase
MVYLHQVFLSIEAAREAIKQHVLNNSELYKTKKSDKHRFIIICKDNNCNFRIRAAESEKQVVSITVFKLHSCSPIIYYCQDLQVEHLNMRFE